MTTFAYRAADRQGRTRDGVMEAPDARTVVERLRQDACYPIQVAPTDAAPRRLRLVVPALGFPSASSRDRLEPSGRRFRER